MENEVKKDIKNMSLGEMAEEALKKAVARVVEEHRKSGEPLAVWRDGEVVHVPADQLQRPEGRRESKLPESEKQNELPRIMPVNDGTRASSGLFGNMVHPVDTYFDSIIC